ncbi:protein tyrosine phosphatase domain-containing protein 1-like [Oppia nitens]|uniref:protein tyrosine phosphatase domain-containing protein 1-like n=1 Tax=Oppia nitens TaxID=1686743 RepID=UPI0023DA1329|nr:protein tyrosine phosphatase domain-containing protein 1-like [Oppia nitens]
MPTSNYTKLSESIRKSTNQQLLCNMFCGGKKCKYELSNHWTDQQKAIPGVYSHWITDDILAMARPNTDVIEKYDLIKYFHKHKIKSIINLQEPGEHSSCGIGLNKSGFSYDPATFMDNKVYFYNFQWKDYSIVSNDVLLDMVKVLTFALSEGKTAIHCHAGLGRTGVLIASYLVFTLRCKPYDAIKHVRSKRPNSIQTRGQILCVIQFSQYVVPLFVVYQHIIDRQIGLNLSEIIHKQRLLLHGYELRHLKYIPKLIYMVCERLLKLCGRHRAYSPGVVGKVDTNVVGISYQLDKTESFCNHFFANTVQSKQQIRHDRRRHQHQQQQPRGRPWRPESNNTATMTSGIASPDTDQTDITEVDSLLLDERYGGKTVSSDRKSVAVVSTTTTTAAAAAAITNGKKSSAMVNGSKSGPTFATLEPDILSSISAPMHQINAVGLETPMKKFIYSSTSANNSTSSSMSNSDTDEPIDSSMSESITSLIESLAYGVIKIDSNQMVYEEKVFKLLNSNHNLIDKNQYQNHYNNDDEDNDEELYDERDLFSDSDDSDADINVAAVTAAAVANGDDDQSLDAKCSSGFMSANNFVGNDSDSDDNDVDGDDCQTLDVDVVVKALLTDYKTFDNPLKNALILYQKELNTRPNCWDKVSAETNVNILAALLWSFIDSLPEPVLNKTCLCYLVLKAEKPLDALTKLEQSIRFTVEYLMRFMARLAPGDSDDRSLMVDLLLKHLMARLTRQKLKLSDSDQQSVPENVMF